MNDQWYYRQNGETKGPLSRHQLEQLAQIGEIGNASMVWREGLPDWVSVTALDLFGSGATPTPPPICLPPPSRSISRIPPQPTRRRIWSLAWWTMITAAGGLALVIAIAVGWFAHAINESRHDRQSARSKESGFSIKSARIMHSSKQTQRDDTAPQTPDARKSVERVSSNGHSFQGNDGLLPPTGEPPNHDTRVADTPQSARPSISSAQSSPQTAIQPLTPANQPKQPQKTTIIFQEIDIQRAPKFAILGAVSVQDLRYQLLSELRVGEPDDKGVRSVGQLVYDTRLVKSDDLSRAMFEESLRALKGWQFTYKLNRRGEVIEWTTGPTAGRKAAPVEPKGAKGFLVISVLDEDGWKEMAQLSFFVPEEQTAGSQTWSRQMTHDFGPLGHWYGETSFLPKETHNGVLRVDYVHHMTYKSPDKDRGDLPFAIKDALFKAEMAGGTISFDTHARRIQTAQEHFLVKGTISTDILGQATTVQVEEQQAITIRILEQNPWGQ